MADSFPSLFVHQLSIAELELSRCCEANGARGKSGGESCSVIFRFCVSSIKMSTLLPTSNTLGCNGMMQLVVNHLPHNAGFHLAAVV